MAPDVSGMVCSRQLCTVVTACQRGMACEMAVCVVVWWPLQHAHADFIYQFCGFACGMYASVLYVWRSLFDVCVGARGVVVPRGGWPMRVDDSGLLYF